ncbi:hypothetical protein BCR44DRAFT_69585 [Catenaria anguillulae PL171]|uniref:Uncharacterized protein n=1 Tax=Catenaria anguillulae PL171 TaxID=765915 RepID=A0A1Y2HD52_9FUNG|nr:hypothetical protein BCR44DRAFT_69585 [Catenaria anguillulae PL171]
MTLGIISNHVVTSTYPPGDFGLSHPWLLASVGMIIASVLGCIVSLVLVMPKLLRMRKKQPRTLIITTACLLMLVECFNQARILPDFYMGSVNLVHYYGVRTFSFILLGPCLTLVVVYRVLALFQSANQQFYILVLAYIASAIVIFGASLSMWDATLSVLSVGTLDAWHYQWVLPPYGTVVGSMVPLSNLILCIMSLRTDLASAGARRKSKGSRSSTERLKQLSPVSPTPTPAAHANAPATPTRSIESVTAPPSLATQRPRSISSRIQAAYDSMVSPAAISLSRTSWFLTFGQCACWTAFLCLGAMRAVRISQWTRNCFYDLLGSVILLLEASFERLYRFEYERAKSQTRLLTVSGFMALTKPVGGGGCAVGNVGGLELLKSAVNAGDEYGGKSSAGSSSVTGRAAVGVSSTT